MKSNFTKQVCAIVKSIPKGKVMSYGQVAKKAGKPRAARAVAMIMARNFNPEIPCHRVIRSDGSLGGYNRGGEQAKRQLLKGEGAIV